MKIDIKFFKQDGKWYADVPGHSLEDNEMVMGSETLLECLADNLPERKDEITLTFSDEKEPNYLLHFVRDEHDNEGAWYKFDGLFYSQITTYLIQEYGLTDNRAWICNVTHDVFGEHPEEMWLIKIN